MNWRQLARTEIFSQHIVGNTGSGTSQLAKSSFVLIVRAKSLEGSTWQEKWVLALVQT